MGACAHLEPLLCYRHEDDMLATCCGLPLAADAAHIPGAIHVIARFETWQTRLGKQRTALLCAQRGRFVLVEYFPLMITSHYDVPTMITLSIILDDGLAVQECLRQRLRFVLSTRHLDHYVAHHNSSNSYLLLLGAGLVFGAGWEAAP